jgi:imidazolonepropionase
MTEATLLVTGARQLLTVPPGPGGGAKTGAAMEELGIVSNGALAVRDGRVLATGPTETIRRAFRLTPDGAEIDATGCVVLPAFVDPHTHVLFAGTREAEFAMRLAGRSYMEIAATGGGIRSSVRMFRETPDATILADSLVRLDRMAAGGTGTVEVKTGYGLDPAQELRALHLIQELARRHPLSIVPTFLGAHDIPAEYRDRPDAYVDLLVEEMIPRAAALGIARFCDVFCEKGVYSVAQSRRILEAARRAGFGVKLHADEFEPTGGAELAAEMGAVSADHLGRISEAGMRAMARAGVVGVLLPGTLYSLGAREYAPARAMITAGVPVALATDCNPGSSMTESMPWIISLACQAMKMTPAEAVTAATCNAAVAVGLGGQRGSLTPGCRADLQILRVPSYLHLPYHVGPGDLRDLILEGRAVLRDSGPPPLGRRS